MELIRPLDEAAMSGIYEPYMKEAFPPAELRPLAAIHRLMAGGDYLCFGYYPEGTLAAYACFYRHTEKILLLDYLSVLPEQRGSGIGSAFLKALDDTMGDVCVLGEVESPDSTDTDERELQNRRIAFYERAGFVRTQTACILFGVHYVIIARRLPEAFAAPDALRECLISMYKKLISPQKFPYVLKML